MHSEPPRIHARCASDVKDEQGSPAHPFNMTEFNPVSRDSFDLVVEDMAYPVDRLAPDPGIERQTVVGNGDIELRIEEKFGLAEEDQFVEPGDEEITGIFRNEADFHMLRRSHIGTVCDNVIKEGFGGRLEEVIQVRRGYFQTDIRRMVERFPESQSSSLRGTVSMSVGVARMVDPLTSG